MSHARARIEPTGKNYILRIYVTAPGTPIHSYGGEHPRRSLAGHVFYSISDGTVERGYGFSPVESGTCGPGHVVRDEHLAYRSPAYIRTMEITEVQYEALLTYGESALNKDERHFNLQYAGATNSCIDFTWGALNRAGLHREIQLPFGIKLRDKDYDGALKPLDNIREFRRIPDPVPGSPLNREQENELPKRKLWQRLISVEEPQRGPSGVVTQEGRVTGPATPFTDPVLGQLYAALQARDGEALDLIGRQFNRSGEGMRLAEPGEQLHAARQANEQAGRHQGDALART